MLVDDDDDDGGGDGDDGGGGDGGGDGDGDDDDDDDDGGGDGDGDDDDDDDDGDGDGDWLAVQVHLKKHNLYKHSDEYPCQCGVCGKRFKDSSAVRLHERIHSAARPYSCLQCGKSFKTRENLWGHRHRGPCDRRYDGSAAPVAGLDCCGGLPQPASTSSLNCTEQRLDAATASAFDEQNQVEMGKDPKFWVRLCRKCR